MPQPPAALKVLSVREFRKVFGAALRAFRSNTNTQPLLVGAHRAPQAALIPYSLYVELVRQAPNLNLPPPSREDGWPLDSEERDRWHRIEDALMAGHQSIEEYYQSNMGCGAPELMLNAERDMQHAGVFQQLLALWTDIRGDD